MLYRIRIDQRLDKQKPVLEAIREVTTDFVILQGRVYSGNTHKPCWIIEIEDDSDKKIDFTPCIKKLKKILNMPTIVVRQYPSTVWVFS